MTEEYAYQMAIAGKRSHKFRHVFGEPVKENACFLDVRNPATSGEGSYLKANHKFWAVAKAAGGGPVYIHKFEDTGRLNANEPTLGVHKGKTLDLDFHPFIPNMLATVSDDCTAMVSLFPIEGMTESIHEPKCILKGHAKKVILSTFHPTASSILGTASFDRSVKLWDIEAQDCAHTFKGATDNIYSLEWNLDGSRLALSSKDKKLYLFDPRCDDSEAQKIEAFDGAKSSKVFWVGNLGWIGAYGFSKTANRILKIWDIKDLSKPILSHKIDAAASVLLPKYDEDTGLLFSYGKGDGTINWSELVNDNKKFYPLGNYRSNEPQKGGNFVPKKGLDVWKCEIQRFLKLTKSSVIPIPICVPRKAGADIFQEDIYPESYAGKSSLLSGEYLNGDNSVPIKMSLNPEKRNDQDDNKEQEFKVKKTYQQLLEENNQLKDKVREYEQKLGIDSTIDNLEDDDEKKED